MKIIKKILLFLLGIIVLLAIVGFFYLNATKPDYTGKLTLPGLTDSVNVFYDEWGIPHIYAKNETDAYHALGYVHAQERLFQMEMMRRVAYGRLAEILGKDLVETDKFFLALGLEDAANKSILMNHKPEEPFGKAAQAYIDGINDFIAKGTTPVEFRILGIPKEKFIIKDLYMIAGYMAFTFTAGFTMDPIVDHINKTLGPDYMKNLGTSYPQGTQQIPSNNKEDSVIIESLVSMATSIREKLPVPTWTGSNSWVLSGKKTKSGSVIFSNDTHIGYGQPSVFYEAHLEYPGFTMYGNFLGGIPFAMLGHNQDCAWGLTMFENDDLDMFREKINPENKDQVWVKNHWEELKLKKYKIKVKDAGEVEFEVKVSRHGPIMNSLLAKLDSAEAPVAVWWSFPQFDSRIAEAFYKLNHSKNIKEASEAASLIYSPGLNVMYGDKAGNIAWWAAAKLVKRPPHVNSKIILDGSSGKDDYLGFYDFSQNPKCINPESGFVFSANNQPDTMAGILYPGYYAPEFRARRIVHFLDQDKKWTIDEMKKMITDNVSEIHPEMAKLILTAVDRQELEQKGNNYKTAFQLLNNWKGAHNAEDIEPTLYYKLLYNVLYKTFVDEIGEKDFDAISSGHMMGNTYPFLFKDENSPWWDDKSTPEKETRQDIFKSGFYKSVDDLEKQLGMDMDSWKWGKVHLLKHGHPIGTVKPFDKVFNVGPFAAPGGNQTLNNIDFDFNKNGIYESTYGPAVRILLDFSDIENSISILPTGESGNFMSPHYADQAEMYAKGEFRKQMMNKEEIVNTNKGKLVLVPEK